MQSYTHLTLFERESLQRGLEQGKSFHQIAKELGRSPSTISREMKRNGKKDGSCNAWWGTSLYLYRRKRCRRHFRLEDETLATFVMECLDKAWSPEIIVERWKMMHPQSKLSHSTIYSALNNKRLPGYLPKTHLRRRGKRLFTSRGSTGVNPVKPDHNISEWTDEIKNRLRFGDWEGDTVRGGVGKGYLITMIDRKTRMVVLGHLPGQRTKDLTAKEICRMMADVPVESITLDNGTEFADHRVVAKKLKTTVYFADPGKPWQRGSNENLNGLLRFFFPKGCDLRDLTPEHIASIVDLLNNRPRKCLGWLSPNEFISKCCT
jgi:IS30 family transposase